MHHHQRRVSRERGRTAVAYARGALTDQYEFVAEECSQIDKRFFTPYLLPPGFKDLRKPGRSHTPPDALEVQVGLCLYGFVERGKIDVAIQRHQAKGEGGNQPAAVFQKQRKAPEHAVRSGIELNVRGTCALLRQHGYRWCNRSRPWNGDCEPTGGWAIVKVNGRRLNVCLLRT